MKGISKMDDNELILFDRLEIIKSIVNKYGEENFYISFSGGKDSTVLHYLIDEAIPNNNIPRVYSNTGMEHIDIVKHVKSMASKDSRIIIKNAGINIRNTLQEKGYPFKSKHHSFLVDVYQRRGEITVGIANYINQENYTQHKCPKKLLYQFTPENKLRISSKCCDIFKKSTFKKFEKETGKKIAIIGVRIAEGGIRSKSSGCVVFTDKSRKSIKYFKPLNPLNDEFIDWYIESRNIKLCKLYYPPFNFKRTGCKGCPYNIKVFEDLEKMKEVLPAEYKQCEMLWKPVYDEYRRIGYRVKNKKGNEKNQKESNKSLMELIEAELMKKR